MMGFQAMAKTATRSIELEPIDRLEEKLKRLVGMVERMQGEQARAAEENQRLGHELDAMRARLAASDSLSNELSSLKEERDVIRTRVMSCQYVFPADPVGVDNVTRILITPDGASYCHDYVRLLTNLFVVDTVS